MGFSSFSSLSSFSSDVFREEKGLGTMLWEGDFVSSREQVGFQEGKFWRVDGGEIRVNGEQ